LIPLHIERTIEPVFNIFVRVRDIVQATPGREAFT
jgi:hypothetical protein